MEYALFLMPLAMLVIAVATTWATVTYMIELN